MIPFFIAIISFLKVLREMLKDPEFRSLLYLAVLTLAIGTIFYHSVEGWRWLDSFYFSVITLTTIGFGDFTPKTDIGKIFTVIYIFVGLGILLGFITPIGEYLVDRRVEKIESSSKEKPEENMQEAGSYFGELQASKKKK